MFIAGIRII
jgi:hypothetical protein